MTTVKRYYKNVKDWIVYTGGLIRSCWIYAFMSRDKARIFNGFYHWEIAKKYAARRTRRYKPEWDQDGKLQGIQPIEGDNAALLVCSKLELDFFKKAKILGRNVNTRKMFKRSYYTTHYPKP